VAIRSSAVAAHAECGRGVARAKRRVHGDDGVVARGGDGARADAAGTDRSEGGEEGDEGGNDGDYSQGHIVASVVAVVFMVAVVVVVVVVIALGCFIASSSPNYIQH
jgi:hypothetical protein